MLRRRRAMRMVAALVMGAAIRPRSLAVKDLDHGLVLVLDQADPGQRRRSGDAAAGRDEVISDVLLNVGIVRRHRVHGHDCLEATQDRLGCGMEYRTVRRGTGHDHGLDAMVLQYFLKVGVEKLVWSALND